VVRKAAAAITSSIAALGLLVCSSAYAAVAAQPEFVNTLMPQPAQFTVGTGRLKLGGGLSAMTDRFHDERLDAAIARMLARLSGHTGTREASVVARAVEGQARLLVSVDGPGQLVQSIDEDESYTLEVTAQGAHLTAKTDVGAIRGLETLLKLVQTDGTTYFIPAISIHDQPRFLWRGLMIDCSRHFEPIEKIERTLDAMAAVKMNVFHWHLTDDQGFRIESLVFPKLTGMGSDGEYYTQRQAREVVAYARARGIRVVPEFDMPGHATAWMVGYSFCP
jgi:hexosaminidase